MELEEEEDGFDDETLLPLDEWEGAIGETGVRVLLPLE
jgi:hypothetical protein